MPLHATVLGVRDAIVAALADATRPAFERVVVADGADVAYDCEELVLAVEGVRTGIPGEAQVTQLDGRATWVATIAVHAVRCAPTVENDGDAPSPDEILASAASVQGDADAMMAGVYAYARECRRAAAVTLTFPGPLGGYAVAILRLEVQLV